MVFRRFCKKCGLIGVLLAVFYALPAYAQTVATSGESQVGVTSCAVNSNSADFDTMAQCNASSGTGTFQKAPLFIGAVTSPPYSATTCGSTKAGMIQYTSGTLQLCNGTAWSNLLTSGGASGVVLGASVTTPNPYGSATDLTTGFYTTGTGHVDVTVAGVQELDWSSAGESLSGQSAQAINMFRETTAATAGNNLTLQAGGAVSVGTNLNGGNLILASGIATGTGSSNIQFNTYNAGSTGTTDDAAFTALTLSATGATGTNAATSLQANAGSGTNQNGGTLTLASGVSTGTGTSNISFNVYGIGTTGATANSATTAMTIAGTGYVGIGTTSPVATLQVNGGVVLGSSATAPSAVVYNPITTIPGCSTAACNNGFLGIYDPSNAIYYGISRQLPAPTGVASIGGYYKGLGIGGSTSGAGNPIFGVLSSAESLNGIGSTAFTVYDNNKIVTYHNVLDDGSGNVGIGSAAPLVSLDLSQKSDAVALPVGTNSNRPTSGALASGEIRYNTATPAVEYYNGTTWISLLSSGGSSGSVLGTSVTTPNPYGSASDTTTGFYRSGAGHVDVTVTGVQEMDLSSAGESLSGQSAQTFGMFRETTASTAGNNLTVQAGGAVSAGTNLNGGNLILASGTATGTGSSNIQFTTYNAGSTGTTDDTAFTALTLSATGATGVSPVTTLQANAGSGTNQNGGSLTLASGVSTGTGTSNINFNIYKAGSTGATANSATTAMTVGTNGYVGIGTATPASTLSVNGGLAIGTTYAGTNAAGSNNLIVQGSVGIGTTSSNTALDIVGNHTVSGWTRIGSNSTPSSTNAGDLTATRLNIGNTIFLGTTGIGTLAGTITDYSVSASGLYVHPLFAPLGTTTTAQLSGMNVTPVWTGTNNMALGYALNQSNDFRLQGSVSNAMIGYSGGGVVLTANSNNFGTITQAIGGTVYGVNSFGNTVTGTIAKAIGLSVAESNVTSQTITYDVGIQIAAIGNGTNNTALLMGTTTAPLGSFGIYDASANNNYFAGNVGIGSTTPVVSLDLSQEHDAVALPVGTNGNRPTSGALASGEIRYNTATPAVEYYNGTTWVPLDSSGSSIGSGIVLGTSVTVPNPYGSASDTTTGLYTSGAGHVDVTATGVQVADISSAGINIATGSLKIAGVNGVSFPGDYTTDGSIAIGSGALAYQVAGTATPGTQGNTAIGYQALSSTGLTTGAISDTAIGGYALQKNTSGAANVALGLGAVQSNTSASNNVGVGPYALNSITTSGSSVAVGRDALFNSTGGSNTGVGYTVGRTITSGTSNTLFGYEVGSGTLSTGSSNILIGVGTVGVAGGADTPLSSTSNYLNIGNTIEGSTANASAIGRETLYLNSIASSVNYVSLSGGATGTGPTIAAAGGDTNVALNLTTLGTGALNLNTAGSGNIVLTPGSGSVVIPTGSAVIGSTAALATLDVAGSVYSRSVNVGSGTTVNWATSNTQYTTASCGAFSFSGMQDGGSYTLAVEGTTSGTCSFSNSDSPTLTFKLPSNHGATTASTMTLYNFIRAGTYVIVTWMPGY